MKEIESIKKDLEVLKCRVENFEKKVKKDFVAVPEGVEVNRDGDIIFNKGRQLLYIAKDLPAISNLSFRTNCADRFVLVPCKREDLKSKDTAFRSDDENPEFKSLVYWCKIQDEKHHAYISKTDMKVSSAPWIFWWKLVPKTEVGL